VITIERTFTVTAPPSAVIEYLKDFGNAEQWDPGTESCVRNGGGPVTVGSSWHNVSKIFGVKTELTYALEALERDRIVLEGRTDRATSTDTSRSGRSAKGPRSVIRPNWKCTGSPSSQRR
jgi:hypothetical protein